MNDQQLEIDPRKWKVNGDTVTLPVEDLRVLQNAYNREIVRLSAIGGHRVRP